MKSTLGPWEEPHRDGQAMGVALPRTHWVCGGWDTDSEAKGGCEHELHVASCRFYNLYHYITIPDVNIGFLLNQHLFPPLSPLPPRSGQKRSPRPRPQLNSGDPWPTGRWAGAGVPHTRPQGPSQAGSCGGGS